MDMRGSGIYIEDITGLVFTCGSCKHENDGVDGYIDDWGTRFGMCEKCEEHTQLESSRDDD